MFRAIGVGHSRSLASAAALNWVLKDGLGRLSRCLFTASIASAFDTNLKVSSVCYFFLDMEFYFKIFLGSAVYVLLFYLFV